MDSKRKYIVSATAVFSLAMAITFVPMIWPNGMHGARDLAWFVVVLLLAVASGLLFSLLTWRALKGWFVK
jgi:hypothetical protein